MCKGVLWTAYAAALVVVISLPGCKTGNPFAPPKCTDCANATCERHQPKPEVETAPGQSPFLPTPRVD
jgi:hypothetical protein